MLPTLNFPPGRPRPRPAPTPAIPRVGSGRMTSAPRQPAPLVGPLPRHARTSPARPVRTARSRSGTRIGTLPQHWPSPPYRLGRRGWHVARDVQDGPGARVVGLAARVERHFSLEQDKRLLLAVVGVRRAASLGQDQRLEQREGSTGLSAGQQRRVRVTNEKHRLTAVWRDVYWRRTGTSHGKASPSKDALTPLNSLPRTQVCVTTSPARMKKTSAQLSCGQNGSLNV